MSGRKIGGRSNWRERMAAAHRPQPHVPSTREHQSGLLPELAEPTHASPPPPPPPPPSSPPASPPADPSAGTPGNGDGAAGPWPWSSNQKLSAFTRCVVGGCVLALLFGELADQLGWSELFRQRRILGHAPPYPTFGNVIRLLCVFGGLSLGLTHLFYDSKFGKTLFEVVVVLTGILVAAFVVAAPGASNSNAPNGVASAAVDSLLPAPDQPSSEARVPDQDVRPTVPMPDGSDVKHVTERKNVAVGRPGQRIKHPIVLQNRGQTWWRDRYLCREGRERDSQAVESATTCIPIPVVPPGESVELTLEFMAPPVPDWYEARWKQATQASGFVYPDADPVIIHVRVDERF
jgi:hypothetical protein